LESLNKDQKQNIEKLEAENLDLIKKLKKNE